MTIGPPNIMTIWRNMLHDITNGMQEKNRNYEQKLTARRFSKFIKGKHGFYDGGKLKILNPILVRKS